MARYCEYCGLSLGPNDTQCPNCGAPAPAVEAAAPAPEAKQNSIPRTIEELKSFCREHNMPLAQMRFFIGQDYPDARAFGIYRDYTGDYVVYKNKADGSRAIRYRGPDEAYAVREIYLKLKDETARRRGGVGSGTSVRSSAGVIKKRAGIFSAPIWIAIAVVLAFSFIRPSHSSRPNSGYYRYDNNYYYYQGGDWYYYNSSMLDWVAADIIDQELRTHYDDYYTSSYYHEDFGIEDFSDTSYYDPYADEDDSSDDWDYDYDSWDAGDTDWDSDW